MLWIVIRRTKGFAASVATLPVALGSSVYHWAKLCAAAATLSDAALLAVLVWNVAPVASAICVPPVSMAGPSMVHGRPSDVPPLFFPT